MSNIRFGDYPAGYDPATHGPYDPARYYGKPDTPFSDLKLKEVPAWIGRREKGPRELMGLLSRAFWRWQHKYVLPRKTGIAPLAQIAVGGSMFFYYLNYYRIRGHRNYKYH